MPCAVTGTGFSIDRGKLIMGVPVFDSSSRVAVVGLGYVGLPLAVALAKSFETVGFDISEARVAELNDGHDRTDEISPDRLKASSLQLSCDVEALKGCAVYIVTVPTPVDKDNIPDLGAVRGACKMLGPLLGSGAIVVFESTVYPGVTEEICGPILEEHSELKCGQDLFLGYSPERINPGDREHTVDRIIKVISGENEDVVEALAVMYGAVTTGGVFRARSIRAAEAAKVIENAQRDINIAFVNEIAKIFRSMGLSVYDVLEAAGTKWNFLPFQPGLVGGHCIGVDPFYLAYKAKELGHDPKVILAGRHTNDGMGDFIAGQIASELAPGARVLMLGLTFKENVPDLRNSRVIDVINGLKDRDVEVDIHDPLADHDEAKHEYGVTLLEGLPDPAAGPDYDGVVCAVSHDAYVSAGIDALSRHVREGGLIADIKGIWRDEEGPAGIRRWQL